MTKAKFLDFEVLKEEISETNVVTMAEVVAFMETRHLIGFMGTPMQIMFSNLCVDLNHKHDVNYTFSNSYELVQECGLFLCQHYGRHLDDIIGYSKKGKRITIEVACQRQRVKLVSRKARDSRRHVSTEELSRAEEPRFKIQEETEHDYTAVDKIVDSLNLTDNMKLALECRMAGLSYPEIGRILERAQSTVFEYFIKMRQRYVKIYG